MQIGTRLDAMAYTEEESSDSAARSEYSFTQVRRSDIGLPGNKAYLSEGYASSTPSWITSNLLPTRYICFSLKFELIHSLHKEL